jgi:RNA polymerase sigma-70 factor (ECF subfamily)
MEIAIESKGVCPDGRGSSGPRSGPKGTERRQKCAFDLLVRKYQYKIIKLISRYVHDPSEALDVSQEAFLKAYRALPGFRGDSAFYTWLYRIAINTAKNYLVAQGRRPPGSDIDAQEAEQYEGQSAAEGV